MKTKDNGLDLSSLLDEELGYHESLTLMGKIEGDRDLSVKLHRYAAVKEYMKSGNRLIPDEGFVDRIHAAIDEEPVIFAPRALRKPVSEKLTTYAIAASMAVVGLLVGRSLTDYSPHRAGQLLAEAELTSPVTQASMEPDLRDYLTLHNETSYLSGGQGMMPSIRLVSGSVGR